MKYKRRCRTIALCIVLMILLSILSAILFMEVDSDMPMYEKGVDNEQRETD